MRKVAAIVEREKCHPERCQHECIKFDPLNRVGKEGFHIGPLGKSEIANEVVMEFHKISAKKCPFNAIKIINLPEKLDQEPVHRFGQNQFELFTLPTIKEKTAVGIIGRNGIGKSTALSILSGNLRPNLGNFANPASDEQIIEKYKRTIMGEYFLELLNKKLKLSYKPQRVELLTQAYEGKVKDLLKAVDERKVADQLVEELDLSNKKNSDIKDLSGGELQRLAIIAAISKKADVYYFDEPASFLDIVQRIKAAKVIKNLAKESSVIVVEHDLATLDYISDEIQIFYGEPAAYGVVSQSKAVSRGINEYLDGYLPDDNVRFRDYSIKFLQRTESHTVRPELLYKFNQMEKKLDDFNLTVDPGELKKGEVLCIMGANGLGKSTFLKLLAGQLTPDKGKVEKISFSYKPQYLQASNGKTVEDFLKKAAGQEFNTGWFKTNILEKLNIENILPNMMETLSGGELQKVLVAATLSSDAKLLILDEPSAFIDVEDRLKLAEVIREFVSRKAVSAIVVDHDIQFIDYLADSIIVFEGTPGREGKASGIHKKEDGMNKVLKILDITYRLDQRTLRPRINKPGSQLDSVQRKQGKYYAFN